MSFLLLSPCFLTFLAILIPVASSQTEVDILSHDVESQDRLCTRAGIHVYNDIFVGGAEEIEEALNYETSMPRRRAITSEDSNEESKRAQAHSKSGLLHESSTQELSQQSFSFNDLLPPHLRPRPGGRPLKDTNREITSQRSISHWRQQFLFDAGLPPDMQYRRQGRPKTHGDEGEAQPPLKKQARGEHSPEPSFLRRLTSSTISLSDISKSSTKGSRDRGDQNKESKRGQRRSYTRYKIDEAWFRDLNLQLPKHIQLRPGGRKKNTGKGRSHHLRGKKRSNKDSKSEAKS